MLYSSRGERGTRDERPHRRRRFYSSSLRFISSVCDAAAALAACLLSLCSRESIYLAQYSWHSRCYSLRAASHTQFLCDGCTRRRALEKRSIKGANQTYTFVERTKKGQLKIMHNIIFNIIQIFSKNFSFLRSIPRIKNVA